MLANDDGIILHKSCVIHLGNYELFIQIYHKTELEWYKTHNYIFNMETKVISSVVFPPYAQFIAHSSNLAVCIYFFVRILGRPKYVTVLSDSKFEVSHSEFQIYLPKKSLKKIFKNFE